MRAGISKASRVRMNVRISTDSTLGVAMGRVTRLNTCQSVLPATTASSSREGSMERNGVAMSRKTMGSQRKPSVMTIPAMEKMSRTGPSPVTESKATLTNPALGPSSRIQPMTLTMPGMANETKADTYATARKGALVRSASHAISVPSTSDHSALPNEKTKEFQESSAKSENDSKISTKWVMVKPPTSAPRSTVRLK